MCDNFVDWFSENVRKGEKRERKRERERETESVS